MAFSILFSNFQFITTKHQMLQRLCLQILVALMFGNFSVGYQLVRAFACYICSVTTGRQISILARSIFGNYDSEEKWGNQLFEVVSTQPTPFLVSCFENESLIFYNYSADLFIDKEELESEEPIKISQIFSDKAQRLEFQKNLKIFKQAYTTDENYIHDCKLSISLKEYGIKKEVVFQMRCWGVKWQGKLAIGYQFSISTLSITDPDREKKNMTLYQSSVGYLHGQLKQTLTRLVTSANFITKHCGDEAKVGLFKLRSGIENLTAVQNLLHSMSGLAGLECPFSKINSSINPKQLIVGLAEIISLQFEKSNIRLFVQFSEDFPLSINIKEHDLSAMFYCFFMLVLETKVRDCTVKVFYSFEEMKETTRMIMRLQIIMSTPTAEAPPKDLLEKVKDELPSFDNLSNLLRVSIFKYLEIFSSTVTSTSGKIELDNIDLKVNYVEYIVTISTKLSSPDSIEAVNTPLLHLTTDDSQGLTFQWVKPDIENLFASEKNINLSDKSGINKFTAKEPFQRVRVHSSIRNKLPTQLDQIHKSSAFNTQSKGLERKTTKFLTPQMDTKQKRLSPMKRQKLKVIQHREMSDMWTPVQEDAVKRRHDIENTLGKNEIRTLLRNLRMLGPNDDDKVDMMRGIFSLANFIESTVEQNIHKLKEKGLLKSKLDIENMCDSFQNGGQLATIEDDSETSMVSNSARLHNESNAAEPRSSKFYPRLIRSPGVQFKKYSSTIIQQDRSSSRQKSYPGSIMTPNMLHDRSSDNEDSFGDSMLFEESVIKNNTVLFNTQFLESSSAPFVVNMKTLNRKKWIEQKIELAYPNRLSILVADDIMNQHEGIRNQLKNLDVEIMSAYDGEQALKHVKNKAQDGMMFHVILMDVHMPNMDGYESTECIRLLETEQKYATRNHVIAISADDDDMMIPLIKQHKMDDFIKKPISKPLLFKKLNEALRRAGIQEISG